MSIRLMRNLGQLIFLIVYATLMLGLLGTSNVGVYAGVGVFIGVGYLAVWMWLKQLAVEQREAAEIILLYLTLVSIFAIGISIGFYANSGSLLLGVVVCSLIMALFGLFFYVRLWGTVLAIRGDLDGAIHHLSLVLGTRLRSVGAYMARAQLRQRTADLDGAISDFSTVIRLHPHHLMALVNRAEVYAEKRAFDAALADYDAALAAQPGLAAAFMGKVNVFIRRADYGRVIYECNQGLNQQLTPFVEAALFISRGIAHALQGNYALALDDFNAATEVRVRVKDQPSIMYLVESNRGMVYFCRKDYSVAAEHMRRAHELMPTEERVQAGMAVCAYALGERKDAHAYWRALMDKDRRYWHIAWVRQRLNWPDPMVDTAEIIILESDGLHA